MGGWGVAPSTAGHQGACSIRDPSYGRVMRTGAAPLSARAWTRLVGTVQRVESAAEIPHAVSAARRHVSARVVGFGLFTAVLLAVLTLLWPGLTAPPVSEAMSVPRTGEQDGVVDRIDVAARSPTPTPTATTVVVHVVGAVRRAGVVSLPAGSRVADAVAAAGGALAAADLASVNLARPVTDGEQVRVLREGEAPPTTTLVGAGTTPGAATPPMALVPLNTADAAALDALPGVGPVLAARIVAWRSEHGRFTSVDELAEVSGIGARLLETLRPLVTL